MLEHFDLFFKYRLSIDKISIIGYQILTDYQPRSRFLKSTTAATVVGGPKTFGRTKKLNSIRCFRDQPTWGTNKIQDAERRRKLDIATEFDKSFDFNSPE